MRLMIGCGIYKSMKNTKRLIVCSRQSYKDTPFAIHAAGCSDVERTEKRVNAASLHEIDGPVQNALDYILDEEMRDMGYDESHVKVFPCCEAKTDKAPAGFHKDAYGEWCNACGGSAATNKNNRDVCVNERCKANKS